MKRYSLIILIVTFFLFSCKSELKYKNGIEVIKAMHEKYDGKWYKNLTFSQGVEQYKDEKIIKKEVWHEAYKAPSNLIIKFRSLTSGNGYLFLGDSLHIYAHHKLAASRKHNNFLVTLGFDVYNQPVDKTVRTLTDVKFDLEKVTSTSFNGKDVYVVGVSSLEEKTNHFYIDAENLVFLKSISYTENAKRETVFKSYKNIEGNLIATEVDFLTNGKLDMTEKYYNIEFPKSIADSVYDKNKFVEAKW